MIRVLINHWHIRRIKKRVNRLFVLWDRALVQGDTATAIEIDGLTLRLIDHWDRLVAENKRWVRDTLGRAAP